MQLTIDEVIHGFDESLANWQDVFGNHEECFVKSIIPQEALSPLEQHYSGPDHPEKDKVHMIWRDYVVAIWGYIQQFEYVPHEDTWDMATERLKEYRDKQEPCPMEVTRHQRSREDFKPAHVVEYL